MERPIPWDELRLIRALGEARGIPGAAQALGLDPSTVFRRLNALEAALGEPVFERHRAGYEPTPLGEEMLRIAGRIAEEVGAFERRLAGREIVPAGEIRVATADSLLIHLLTPVFARFQAAHPAIRLDIAVGNPAANLSRRDADVAIRATDHPPDTLVGRRAGRIAWALYGRAADFPDRTAIPGFAELCARPWVALGADLGTLAVVRVAERHVPPDGLRYRTNTVLGLADAVEEGIGIGHLPCFVGDSRPALVRLAPPEPAFAADLWLLTHPDLRQSPRIRLFMDGVGAELARLRPLLEG